MTERLTLDVLTPPIKSEYLMVCPRDQCFFKFRDFSAHPHYTTSSLDPCSLKLKTCVLQTSSIESPDNLVECRFVFIRPGMW